MEYKIIKNEYGDILECDSCGTEAPLYNFKDHMGSFDFCELCSSTFISNAHKYPNQYSFLTPQMFAQGLHWLRKELMKQLIKQPPSQTEERV